MKDQQVSVHRSVTRTILLVWFSSEPQTFYFPVASSQVPHKSHLADTIKLNEVVFEYVFYYVMLPVEYVIPVLSAWLLADC